MMMLPNAIFRCLFLIGLTAIGFGGSLAFAQPPGEESVTHIARKLPGSVLREGGLPHDSRLGPLRGEKGDFPLIPTFSSKEWAAQKQRVRHGGRSFLQSRCVQLARMGCVVFHYDMIGYGDSQQIPLDVIHRFSHLRVNFKNRPTAGFYSARAELQLFNPMGLHTYNSIRALDFLCSLPDVDPARIAVTGGSGGGTQTFMLCAVDDRPLVSVPMVIVSAHRSFAICNAISPPIATRRRYNCRDRRDLSGFSTAPKLDNLRRRSEFR